MTYLMIAFIIVMIFTIVASIKVKTTFNKYNKIQSSLRITGAQAAQRILYANGISDVTIKHTHGELTDHYNPRDNSLNLSDDVYNGISVAAIGVACHEAGHAIQYAKQYAPIKLRMAIIPLTNFGSRISGLLIFAGLILTYFSTQFLWIANIGLILFGFSVLFQLITLPIELDASNRAMYNLKNNAILTQGELKYARKVLTAAAMTYVAALAVSLVQFIRFYMIINGNKHR